MRELNTNFEVITGNWERMERSGKVKKKPEMRISGFK